MTRKYMPEKDIQRVLIECESARIRQLSALIKLLGEKGVLSEEQLKKLDALKPIDPLDDDTQ